jgi:two-component system LytT family sensor kinase
MGLAITSWLLRPLYRRHLGADASLRKTIVVTALASYVAGILWTGAHGVSDIWTQRVFLVTDARLTSIWQVVGGTLYDAFILLSWSVLYVGIKHQLALGAARERALRAESLAQNARLEALRAQVSPHFLFNTLNAISTLVMDGRRDDAVRMIASVADFLRTTLLPTEKSEVTVREELDATRRYLAIEEIRFGDRLRAEVEAESEALGARVPPLILQPLVENAVRHAAAEREEGGRVVIRASRHGDRVRLSVEDDGPGMQANGNGDSGRTGLGIANTRDRLQHQYGAAHRFTLDRSALGGLSVVIEIPSAEAAVG